METIIDMHKDASRILFNPPNALSAHEQYDEFQEGSVCPSPVPPLSRTPEVQIMLSRRITPAAALLSNAFDPTSSV